LLRTGIDLLEIDRLEELNPGIRRRFLERVFSPAELEIVGDSDASIAGRFAAKEAVAKALGCGIGPVSWLEIEVLRGPSGEPELHLHGKAEQLAAQLGLVHWSLSISHSKRYAVAMAVASSQPSS